MALGKITHMALSSNQDMLALYSQWNGMARVIVMRTDRSRAYSKIETPLNAKSLYWCGSDAPVLTFSDSIVLVGPEMTLTS